MTPCGTWIAAWPGGAAEELLADYSLAAGRTWPLVLAWVALGPEVVRSLDR